MWLFCLSVSFFPDEIAFSIILRIKTILFGRHSILREKKSQLASNFELTRTLTIYGEHGIIAELHPRAKRARGRSPIAKEML